jgi:spore germination protein GerM
VSRSARLLIGVGGALVAAVVAWLLFVGLPRWTAAPAPTDDEEVPSASVPPSDPGTATPRIKARLFYVAADGLKLRPVEQEVPLGTTAAAQARLLVEAQLAPPPDEMVSAVPQGTTLKELFLTARGEAYVDLSGEVAKNHSGGSLDELLTVYTLVAVLTENLPSVSRVQILVDGREVDTLAGHVDLRRPLSTAAEWIEAPGAEAAPGTRH